jgi:hypothetical protein
LLLFAGDKQRPHSLGPGDVDFGEAGVAEVLLPGSDCFMAVVAALSGLAKMADVAIVPGFEDWPE